MEYPDLSHRFDGESVARALEIVGGERLVEEVEPELGVAEDELEFDELPHAASANMAVTPKRSPTTFLRYVLDQQGI